MIEYTEPKYCLLCSQPTSLCQCPTTITDKDELIRVLACEGERLKCVIEEKNEALQEAWGEIRKINGSVSEGLKQS